MSSIVLFPPITYSLLTLPAVGPSGGKWPAAQGGRRKNYAVSLAISENLVKNSGKIRHTPSKWLVDKTT
ncbi:hypothetical protein HMPREF0262_02598 [Clostridium sp. ATCC 29733]|nr:hypothetical protein HMPREF0262_02598 [Clostridium sp. ATCC 29733]